ncbi:MAG: hypothetical protein H7Y89_03935 [Steroidobacteraceae bacterium]|nr:hypothetical protein [Steroidobacteraceae bacterium]
MKTLVCRERRVANAERAHHRQQDFRAIQRAHGGAHEVREFLLPLARVGGEQIPQSGIEFK